MSWCGTRLARSISDDSSLYARPSLDAVVSHAADMLHEHAIASIRHVLG